MLATGPAGPEPRKAPLQRPRMAGAFEAMPLACLDGCVPLPKHRAIRVLPVQAVAPAASEEGSGGHLSLTARQGRTPRSRRGGHSSGQNHMVLPLRAGNGRVPGATRGSPRQFEHPMKRGRGMVAGKDSDDVAPGTNNSDMTQ
jgi:predicted RNA binding protein YcfA (HicA-like mRNA interferase family)